MSALNGRRWMLKPRLLWYGISNRAHGRKFGPVGRCRHCEHTTPSHYRWCRKVTLAAVAGRDAAGGEP